MHYTVTGAYGRDYKSKKAAVADWNAGKDFYSTGWDGLGYLSRPQLEKAGYTGDVNIRYKRNTMVTVVKVKSKGGA